MQEHGPNVSSPHEQYAVLLEELDELWDEIKRDKGREESAVKEAVQVGAMALKYIMEYGENWGL